jgi:hypothetical protein
MLGRLRPLSLLPFPALAAVVAPAAAQVGVNWAAIGRFQGGATTSPFGGISLVDLAAPGSPIDVTGLSLELTGSSSGTGEIEGIASLLIDRVSGGLIAGEHSLPGQDTDIHVMYLSGNNVVLDQVYNLGNAAGGGGWVDQMAWLDDDIVFTVRGTQFATGPMAGHLLGILRPQLGPPGTAGTIVPVPLTSIPTGTINALCVDENNGRAYFAMFAGGPLTTIYEVPVPGDGTPVAPVSVAAFGATALSLAYVDGYLLCGTTGAAFSLWRINLNSAPAVQPISGQFGNVNGMDVENATGDVLVGDGSSGQCYRRNSGGGLTALGAVSGAPSSVAVHQSLTPYGQASPGANSYTWVLKPNPGGEPTLGSPSFSMTVASSPGVAIGIGGLSLGEATPPLPVLGVTLLLDAATLVLPTTLLPAPQAAIALPIPATPTLAGAQVFSQAFYLEGPGWAASRGLRVTLLP